MIQRKFKLVEADTKFVLGIFFAQLPRCFHLVLQFFIDLVDIDPRRRSRRKTAVWVEHYALGRQMR